MSPSTALAGEAEMEQLEVRIEILLDEMERLWKAGHEDAAELLERRVHALRRELEAHRARRAEEQEDERATVGEPSVRELFDAARELVDVLRETDDRGEAAEAVTNALRHLYGVSERAGKVEEPTPRRVSRLEIRAAQRRLPAMRLAFKALLAAKKQEAAHRLEYAIHALELTVEGEHGEKAEKVRRSAPGIDEQIELLTLAAALYAEAGSVHSAAQVKALAQELRAPPARQSDRERIRLARDVAERYVKVMKTALPAFREVERMDLLEIMEKAIDALEVQLAGRTDAEARAIVRGAPRRETLIELILFAANLYEEWEKDDEAHALRETGQSLLRRHQEAEDRARGKAPGAGKTDLTARLDRLEDQLHALMEMTQRLRGEMAKIRAEAQDR